MLEALDTYDWEEVFSAGPWHQVSESGPIDDLAEPISREDVAFTLFTHEDESGGVDSWEGQMLAVLQDGRFIWTGGWCDTTGWGCQDWTFHFVGPTLGSLVRWAMSDEERKMTGLGLSYASNF